MRKANLCLLALTGLALAGLVLVPILAPAQPSGPVVQASTQKSAPFAPAIGTTAQLITGVPNTQVYITGIAMTPAAGTVVALIEGTGSACGTNTANLTGSMTFAAGQVFTYGDGAGAIIVVGRGNNVCISVATAAVGGTIAWAQF